MSLSRAFTEHYMNLDPEPEITERDSSRFESRKSSRNDTHRNEERGKVLAFPVVKDESWQQLRMEAQ